MANLLGWYEMMNHEFGDIYRISELNGVAVETKETFSRSKKK